MAARQNPTSPWLALATLIVIIALVAFAYMFITGRMATPAGEGLDAAITTPSDIAPQTADPPEVQPPQTPIQPTP